MINYLKSMVYTLGIILIGTIILTIFNYFNILNGITLKIIMPIIPILAILVGSFKIGKTSNKKGYIEGLKYGSIITILLLTTNLITKNFQITSIIYYISLLLMSAAAGSIGINRKK